jgi:acetoin utilization protein AcuB
MGPSIDEFMTTFPYAIEADTEVLQARTLMLQHRIRHLPVVRGEDLVGLVSDRDIKLILGPEFDSPDPHDVSVADVMIDEPYVVDAQTALAEVVRHMADAHIGAVLVTRSGGLAGIFTASDACRHLANRLEQDAAALERTADAES